MKIGIVDCGGANLNSIYYSFKRLNIDSFISNSIDELSQMDALVLPGVGSAGKVMDTLSKKNLVSFIKETNKPVLGICIGMQILFDYSEEDNTECLGLIKGNITKFNKKDVIAVPQMGWNKVKKLRTKLFNKINEGDYMYLVHSYFVPTINETIGQSEYGLTYSVAVQKENFFGVQFHPEKSSAAGSQLLKNFLEL